MVSTYERLVYRLSFRFMGNHHDACDVSQDVFLRVHRALREFRGESSLNTWIYTITANTARNHLRSRKYRQNIQVLAFLSREHDGKPHSLFEKVADPNGKSPSREVESSELGVRIHQALMELPFAFREPVILRDMENLDYGKIARLLRIKSGTVKSRICRGRAILRTILKDELSEACPNPDKAHSKLAIPHKPACTGAIRT